MALQPPSDVTTRRSPSGYPARTHWLGIPVVWQIRHIALFLLETLGLKWLPCGLICQPLVAEWQVRQKFCA